MKQSMLAVRLTQPDQIEYRHQTPVRTTPLQKKLKDPNYARLSIQNDKLLALSPQANYRNSGNSQNLKRQQRISSSSGNLRPMSQKRTNVRQPMPSSFTIEQNASMVTLVSPGLQKRKDENLVESGEQKLRQNKNNIILTIPAPNNNRNQQKAAKPGQIVSNLQYYSNQSNGLRATQENPSYLSRRIEDDSSDTPIINVSSGQDQTRQFSNNLLHHQSTSSNNHPSNNLHESIGFLTTQLKTLEAKYLSLANFYKQQRHTSSKKPGSAKKTPRTELRDQIKKDLNPIVNNFVNDLEIEKSILSEARTQRDAVEEGIRNLVHANRDSSLSQQLMSYKHRLNLDQDQAAVFDVMCADISLMVKPLSAAMLTNFQLQSEYAIQELKQAVFQIRHLNEQSKLDIQKIKISLTCVQDQKPLSEVNQSLTSLLQKFQSQELYQKSLQQFQDNMVTRFEDFKRKVKDQPADDLVQENHRLRNQLQQQQQQFEAYDLDNANTVQAMDKTISEYKVINSELRKKIDFLSQDLNQKSLLLTQRENQQKDLILKLQDRQVALTGRDTKPAKQSEERWRQTADILASMTQTFLHSMRRLQKVVHKKEPNVAKEKSDFEQAKRDLEITLKTVQKQIEANQSGRMSDQSEIPHKEKNKHSSSTESADRRPPSDKLISSKKVELLLSDYDALQKRLQSADALRQTTESRILYQVKQTLADVTSKQSSWSGKVEDRISWMANRIEYVVQMHAKAREQLVDAREQLALSQQSKKVKEQELIVARAELVSMKADFKEKFKKNENNDLRHQNHKLQEQLSVLTAAQDLKHQEAIKEIKISASQNQQLLDKISELTNQQQETQSKHQSQIKQLEAQVKKAEQAQATSSSIYQQQHSENLKSIQAQWQNRLDQLQQSFKQMQDKNQSLELKYDESVRNLAKEKTKSQKTDAEMDGLKQQIEVREKEAELLTKKYEYETKLQLKQASQKEEVHAQQIKDLQDKIQKLSTPEGNELVNQLNKQAMTKNETLAQLKNELKQGGITARTLQKELDEARLKLEAAEAVKASLDTAVQQLSKEQALVKSLTKDLKDSRLSQSVLKKREEEMSSVAARLEESNKALVETQTSRDDWEQKHSQLQRLIGEKTTEFKAQVGELEKSYKALEKQNQTQLHDLDRQYQSQIQDLESQLKQTSAVLETNQRESNKRADAMKIKVSSLETKVQSLIQDRTDLETKLQELESKCTEQVNDFQGQIQFLKGNRDGLKQKVADLEEESKVLQKKLSETEQNAQLNRQQDSKLLQASQSQVLKLTSSIQALQQLSEVQKTDLANCISVHQTKEQESQQALHQLRHQHQDQVKILKDSISELTRENQKLKQNLTTQGDQLHQMESQNQIKDRFDQQEANLKKMEHDHSTMVRQLELAHQQEAEEMEKKLASSQHELQLMKEEASELIQKLQLQLQEQISKHAKQLQDNDNLMQARCFSLENLLGERKIELQACQAMLTTQTEVNDKLRLQIEAKSEELVQANCKLITAEETMKKLQSQRQFLQVERDNFAKQVYDLDKKVLEFTNLNENHMAQIQDLEQQNEESTATLEKNLLLIQQFKTQLQKSIVDNKAHKDQLIEITKQRDDLQSQNDSLCFFVLEANEQIKGLQLAVFNYQLKEQDTSVSIAPYLEANPRLSHVQASELETLSLENQTLKSQLRQAQQQLQDECSSLQQQLAVQAKSSESMALDWQQKMAKTTAAKEQEISALQTHSNSLQKLVTNLDTQLNDLNSELEAKNELLEEANNLIQDFNEEKHELKAKFKVIIGTLEEKSEVSSYKSTDEIDLNECFEQLEVKLIQNQGRSQKMILDITQQKDELNARQMEQQVQLESRSLQLEQLKVQLGDIQMRMVSQNEMIKQEMDKAELKITKLKTKLKQAQEHKQEVAAKDASSFLTNNSLQAENIQLLDRLQKVEAALQKTRSGGNVDSGQSPSEISNKVQSLRKQFITAYQDCIQEMRQKVASELTSMQQAFLDDKIFQWGLQQDRIVHNWNSRAEQVAQVEFNGRTFLVVADKEAKMYIVAKDNISVETLSYLQTFTVDNVALEARVPESLTRLVADLRQALLELQQEYNQYRAENGLASVETSVVALKDDIEYLSGENRDLHLKVKEICMMNAQLKVQLQRMSEVQVQDDGSNVQAAIETARNLSDMDENEFREQTEFISDHDSFNDIVVRNHQPDVDKPDDLLKAKLQLEQKVSDITMELEQLREQLNHHEENKDESTTIAHIKGTLIQFLRNTPVTEKQNEELLKIVFSMMDFSKSEVQEMTASRTALKSGFAKSNNGNSRSNTSGNSGEDLKTAEKRKTNWLGVFGLKKGSQNTSRQESGHMSPVRPVKQNSQGIQ